MSLKASEPAGNVAPDAPARRSALPAFLAGSACLHLWLVIGALGGSAERPELRIAPPDRVELGIEALPGDPGEPGEASAPAPQAAEPTHDPKPVRAKPEPEPEPRPRTALVTDVENAQVTLDAGASSDTPPASEHAVLDPGAALQHAGAGLAPIGSSAGLGFGAGGFGDGHGGPLGAIVGLHLDMKRIRDSSLLLETDAVLELIPEWTQMLEGSGIDPRRDLERVFVASPSLRRSGLVLSALVEGGERRVEHAVEALARERNQTAAFESRGALQLAPWHDRGPTERVIGLLPHAQVVIGRPRDVLRALDVARAIGARHGSEPGMERFEGARALLAMYEGEEVALSVEGVHHYLERPVSYAPLGLRLSLRHLDEFYAELTAYGYYPSAEAAQAALPALEAFRSDFLAHPKAQYLGLKSALTDAELSARGATITLRVRLTLHQVRYLMGFVRRVVR